MAKETEVLRIRLPRTLIGYLGLLAKQGSVLGADHNDIAAHLLTQEVERIFHEGEHNKRVPTAEVTESDS